MDKSKLIVQQIWEIAAGCLWVGGWCRCGRYGLFSLTWMMLQIVSYIDYYSVYPFNIHVPYLIVLTNQNQALVTLCLHAYLNFILLIVIYMLPNGGL